MRLWPIEEWPIGMAAYVGAYIVIAGYMTMACVCVVMVYIGLHKPYSYGLIDMAYIGTAYM